MIAELGFRPWDAREDGESVLQVLTPGGLRPLTQLSPLTKALSGAWASELHLMAFAASPEVAIEPNTVLERLEPALLPEQEATRTTATTATFAERLLAELPESTFTSYAAFEEAFVSRFNAHVLDLPSGYRWRDALQSALDCHLIHRTDAGAIVVGSD